MKFMQVKPQKARGVLVTSMWTDPEWVAEEKFDGDRRIAQFCSDRVHFTGTRESVDGTGFVEKSANIPHLAACTIPHLRLEGTVLDGEIICPETKGMSGGRSKYVTAVMGSKPERAVALQQQNGWMEYRVFDCLWYKGADIRAHNLAARRIALQQALAEWDNRCALPVPQSGGDKQKFFRQILKKGGEGVILKHVRHTYGDEKLWVKVKGEWTADVVVMGFTHGNGKYAGQVGAICFGQHIKIGNKLVLKELGTCSGFDDALRATFTQKNYSKYQGQVIEIAHNGREPTGAFRHPRFKRFRSDKSPKDCVYREDEI
jgi:ATP-dependent DNA ligase